MTKSYKLIKEEFDRAMKEMQDLGESPQIPAPDPKKKMAPGAKTTPSKAEIKRDLLILKKGIPDDASKKSARRLANQKAKAEIDKARSENRERELATTWEKITKKSTTDPFSLKAVHKRLSKKY